jgi:hypothetical protein
MNEPATLPWLARGGPRKPKPVPKSEWGPRGWHWLHTEAVDYPASPSKTDRLAAFARVWSFLRTLPCPECRVHATNYAREYPPDFSGSAGYQTWAWRFHNAANYRLGKPLMPAEEYRTAYAEEIARSYWNYVG